MRAIVSNAISINFDEDLPGLTTEKMGRGERPFVWRTLYLLRSELCGCGRSGMSFMYDMQHNGTR